MKHSIFAALTLIVGFSTATAQEQEQELDFLTGDPKSACEAILCLSGLSAGENPSECSSSLKEYFGIEVFKKGKFKASKTASERLKFLNKCPGNDSASDVNSKWGTVRK
jgi:hypothetical protein